MQVVIKKVPTVIITGTGSDSLNSNVSIRKWVFTAFQAAFPSFVLYEDHVGAVVSGSIYPDVIIAVGGLVLSADLDILRSFANKTGALLVFWLHEDPFEFDFRHRAIRVADVIFTNDAWCVPHYGLSTVRHLPLGADPSVHLRRVFQKQDRDIDFFFCGVGYPNRVDFFRRSSRFLRRIKGAVFGSHWPSDLDFAFNQRLTPTEVADLTARSRFTINITRSHNIANRRFDLPASTPGPRTFEAALSGTVQLFLSDGILIDEFFKDGEELISFDNVDELESILTDRTFTSEKIFKFARSQQLRALRDHTYEARVRTMWRVLEDILH